MVEAPKVVIKVRSVFDEVRRHRSPEDAQKTVDAILDDIARRTIDPLRHLKARWPYSLKKRQEAFESVAEYFAEKSGHVE